MLQVFDNFDHCDLAFVMAAGWSYRQEFGSQLDIAPSGRNGSYALEYVGESGFLIPPIVPRQCNVLVAGLCIGGWRYEYHGSYHPGPIINIYFKYKTDVYDHTNFCVRLTTNHVTNQITVTCYTGSDGAGYAAIPVSTKIPVPYFYKEYIFIEAYLDVTDFQNGRVKVAVNGRTFVDVSGIVTAAHLAFGSDPFDPRAKINCIELKLDESYLLDSFYLCDDAGGYQNDFLGMVSGKTLYPIADGDHSDWMAVENSTVIDDPGNHHEYVDDTMLADGDEATYLQADQDLSRELFSYQTDAVPPNCSLIAVNHRTIVRNVASPGAPKMNTIVPLYQIQGNPLLEINSLTKRGAGWSYYILDVYHSLVPIFALPWAEYLFDQSQFGFMLRTAENTQMLLEEVLMEDSPDTQYGWDELIEDGLGMIEDIADNGLNTAVWDVDLDDGFDSLDGVEEE